MTTRLTWLLLFWGFVIAASSITLADTPVESRIDRATVSEYQHLWLRCEDGAQLIRMFVGLRGTKSTTVWFVGGDVPGGREGQRRVSGTC